MKLTLQNMDIIDLSSSSDNSFIEPSAINSSLKFCKNDYICLYRSNSITIVEIIDLIDSMSTDIQACGIITIASNIPYNCKSVCDIISSFNMQIHCIILPKKILASTGCFNEYLHSSYDYEYICRAFNYCNIHFIEYVSNNDISSNPSPDTGITFAYILRKYMGMLKESNALDTVFNSMITYAQKYNFDNVLLNSLDKFLNNSHEYQLIDINTEAFLIISGDNTCYNVLQEFSNNLADALVECGQRVITMNKRYGNIDMEQIVRKDTWKAIIGFQAPVLINNHFKNKHAVKMQFWFDNPVFSPDFFHDLDDNYYFLCQDGNYARHIQKYYGLNNCFQLPPAGIDSGMSSNKNRIYDIVFIGTYSSHRDYALTDEFQTEYFNYMVSNPHLTFEDGLQQFLQEYDSHNTALSNNQRLLEMLYSLQNVCQKVICYFREKVIETILTSGIKLDVFGDSWRKYNENGRENLVIHPNVSVSESLEIWGQSRIGLNIMTWHKAGMTERIANIMLSGAVCLSDETSYLLNHYQSNGEHQEIALFSLNHLDELPGIINNILNDEERREHIAQNAYSATCTSDTWIDRAEKILEILPY